MALSFDELETSLRMRIGGLADNQARPLENAADQLIELAKKARGDISRTEALNLLSQLSQPVGGDSGKRLEELRQGEKNASEGIGCLALGLSTLDDAMSEMGLGPEEQNKIWEIIVAGIAKTTGVNMAETAREIIPQKMIPLADIAKKSGLDQKKAWYLIAQLKDSGVFQEGDIAGRKGTAMTLNTYGGYVFEQAARVYTEMSGEGKKVRTTSLIKELKTRMPARENIDMVAAVDTDLAELTTCRIMTETWGNLGETLKNRIAELEEAIDCRGLREVRPEEVRTMRLEIRSLVAAINKYPEKLGDVIKRRKGFAVLTQQIQTLQASSSHEELQEFMRKILGNNLVVATDCGEGGVVAGTRTVTTR